MQSKIALHSSRWHEKIHSCCGNKFTYGAERMSRNPVTMAAARQKLVPTLQSHNERLRARRAQIHANRTAADHRHYRPLLITRIKSIPFLCHSLHAWLDRTNHVTQSRHYRTSVFLKQPPTSRVSPSLIFHRSLLHFPDWDCSFDFICTTVSYLPISYFTLHSYNQWRFQVLNCWCPIVYSNTILFHMMTKHQK